MTATELAQLITDRLMVRATREDRPLQYLTAAVLRLSAVETTDQLVEFGREYGILYSAPDWKTEGGLV